MPADQETIRYTGVWGRTSTATTTSCARCSAVVGRALLLRRRGHDPRRPRLAEPPDRVHRVPLPVPRRAARARGRLRRRGGRYRGGLGYEAHPHAQGRPLHVDRRPVDPRLLGVRGRPAGPSRSPSTSVGRPSAMWTLSPMTNRCMPARSSDPHHRWRRLGDPLARPYDEVEQGPAVGQGVLRGLERTTASSPPVRQTTRSSISRGRTRLRARMRAGSRTPSPSSTAAPGTPGCLGARPPTSTTGSGTSSPPGRGESNRHPDVDTSHPTGHRHLSGRRPQRSEGVRTPDAEPLVLVAPPEVRYHLGHPARRPSAAEPRVCRRRVPITRQAHDSRATRSRPSEPTGRAAPDVPPRPTRIRKASASAGGGPARRRPAHPRRWRNRRPRPCSRHTG